MVSEQAGQHELLPSHNVLRHSRPRDIDPFGVPSANAFRIRDGELYLSTSWLEYFHDSDRSIQVSRACQDLRKKRTVKRNDPLIVLNVGAAVSACKAQNVDIKFITLGELDDPSHTGIYGLTAAKAQAARALAQAVNPAEVYPAG